MKLEMDTKLNNFREGLQFKIDKDAAESVRFRGFQIGVDGSPSVDQADMSQALSIAFLGAGFNSFDTRVRSYAVAADDTNTRSNELNFVSFEMKSVETIEEFREMLHLNVNMSGNGVYVSGSASLDLLRESEFNSYGYFIVIRATIRTLSSFWTHGALTLEARDDAERMDRGQFFEKYGDSFIRQVEFGGDFFGLMTIKTVSRSERERLDLALKVSNTMASADAKIETMYSHMAKTNEVSLRVTSTGGVTTVPDTPQEFTRALNNWRAGISNSQRVVGLYTESYALAWPPGNRPTSYDDARAEFGRFQKNLLVCQLKLNNVNYITDHQDLFDFSDVSLESVSAIREKLINFIENADRAVEEFRTNPLDTKLPVIPPEVDAVLPLQKFKLLPDVRTTVAVHVTDPVERGSHEFAGVPGVSIHYFVLRLRPEDDLKVSLSYQGRFRYAGFPPLVRDSYASLGFNSGMDSERWQLLGLRIFVSGEDAHLVNVCYQVRSINGQQSSIQKNGDWILATEIPFDGIRVWFERR